MKREIKNRLEFFDGKWKELSYIAVLNLLYFTLPLGVSIYSIVYESGMFCYYSIFLMSSYLTMFIPGISRNYQAVDNYFRMNNSKNDIRVESVLILSSVVFISGSVIVSLLYTLVNSMHTLNNN